MAEHRPLPARGINTTAAAREPDHREIYARRAADYERLVSREDHEGNILPALARIAPLAGAEVVESGAGTGRLTRLLAPRVASIRAYDASPPMLQLAAQRLGEICARNWSVQLARHRALPEADGSADIVIAGWSLCYEALWNPARPRDALTSALGELLRVGRPGGTLILLETLGTGSASPRRPVDLADYYALLDGDGFDSTWLRTDYRFESRAEAESLVRFFFGDEMARRVAGDGGGGDGRGGPVVLPECTGIWWKSIPPRSR